MVVLPKVKKLTNIARLKIIKVLLEVGPMMSEVRNPTKFCK